jgi:hypothetical protein
MPKETLSRLLVKAADAAGYAMAASEEDLAELALRQPEVALRNGHAAAARAVVRRMSAPFTRLEQVITHMMTLSAEFSRAHAPRALLPSR